MLRSPAAALAVLLGIGVVAAGCGDDGGGGGGASGDLAMADVERVEPDSAALDPVGEALSAFSADLYREVVAEQGDANVVLSPYSVAFALAMTRAGAAGETAEQMDAVLHADLAGDLHAGYNAIDQALETLSGEVERADGSKAELLLSTANALWGQRGFEFEDPFLELLAADYGAGMHLVDYGADVEGARGEINGWVSEQTRERIPELIPRDVLSDLTRLVLTNAVYLKAPWETPFFENSTEDAPFHRLDGSDVDAPLMAVSEHFGYASGDGWQAVELPYAGGGLAMLVVVPDEGSFADVEASFDGSFLASVAEQLSSVEVDLVFPKFEFRTQAALRDVLTKLGMPLAFDPEQADFSAMTAEQRLFVSAVIHEAFIAVDEEGTEAAAATAVVMGEGSAPGEPVTLTVDRPFLFAIRDLQTATPLFVGRVTDPTATP